MPKKLPILPKKSFEAVQEQLIPYLPSIGKAENDTVFSQNRGNDLSANKLPKDFSIGLKDIDEAIKYYFDNIIKPSVIQNGQRIAIPVVYGNQELWKSVQKDGYYRDVNGKLMAPLITFKRESFEKNKNLTNKLDGNKTHLYQIFEKKYTKENFYDNFSVLNNRKPVKQYVATVVPDYVNIEYQCVVFTEYIEQMNPIIESINFAEGSYWGDFTRFKFRATIDSFTNTTELNIGNERVVKTNFNLKIYGYLIPNTINKDLASIKGYFSKAQILFNLETTTEDLNTINPNEMAEPYIGATNLVDSYNANVTVNTFVTGVGADVATYLNTNITKKADSIVEPNKVIFNNTSMLPPPFGSGLPDTTVNNFTFFINGQYIPSTLVTLNQVGSNLEATFNTVSLGYELSAGGSIEVEPDEVVAIGKFS